MNTKGSRANRMTPLNPDRTLEDELREHQEQGRGAAEIARLYQVSSQAVSYRLKRLSA